MSYSLVLNSSNNISPQNNQFKFNFIGGNLKVPEGAEICVSQITIPYSWYNVSSQLGNNIITYYIANSSNVQTAYTVTLSNGFYDVPALNTALQARMRALGHYWYSTQLTGGTSISQFQGSVVGSTLTVSQTNSPTVQLYIGYVVSYIPVGSTAYINATITAYGSVVGTYTVSGATATTIVAMNAQTTSQINQTIIYPLSLAVSLPTYTTSITSLTVPIASQVSSYFGSNYVQANGLNGTVTWTGGYPTVSTTCPYILIPTTTVSTTTIGNLLGFVAGSYPATNTGIASTVFQTVTLGNSLLAVPPFPVLATQVNAVIVRCNLVDNSIAMPSDVLDNFPITSTFGSNISYLPISDNAVKLKAGMFSSMVISFAVQNYNPLPMNDPNVLISVLIKFPDIKK